uniref:Myotubularin phosphatase domain-containing protein n=1 Tax=Plectus sambesii TaxID=2011161 RepID=A0A914WJT4_9BILA
MELAEAIERSRVNDVFLRKGPRTPQPGSLALTGHHLIFSPAVDAATAARSPNAHVDELWLLHSAVDRVASEAISRDNPSKGGLLTLKCKNFMMCVFEISKLDDCEAVARSIETLSNLNDVRLEYPFFYRCSFTVLDDGWTAFDAEQEFARLQVRSDAWRLSFVNKDFRVCPSYPEAVIVPKGIGDDYLRSSASFREDGRFPVLSYYHRDTRSSILRCSQPLVGPNGRRSKEDEAILNSLLGAAAKGYIIDTRSLNAANSARSRGGGSEPKQNYSRWSYVHRPVPRWKELHDALSKLVEACNDSSASSDRWLSKLGGCGWLQAVADTLTCACVVAQCVDREGETEVPVIVHGAEGTDSTLLVTSLSTLLLDADARTVRGFEGLIEREWIAAGHPFWLRCAHGAYATGAITGPFEAPTFLLFLDCVWQVYQQFPCSFEFTEEFLIFLFEHAYASEFGSFLGNCEKEKAEYGIKKSTVSLWSFVNNPDVLQKFFNALYEPNESPLWPCVAPQSIMLWERLFLRWQRDWTHADGAQATVMQWKSREKELQSKVLVMRRQLVELSKEAQLYQQTQLINSLQVSDH